MAPLRVYPHPVDEGSVAINKRRVLDNARKHAQKGAKHRALKEYNKLIAVDPGDSKLLLEVGDAYRRWGQPEEAVTQYTKVAEQYRQAGFDARAVAVLKQVLNLDPKRYPTYVALSDLYARMGLDAEAISALRTAADGYFREGQRRESLELLRKMAKMDPSNTASRLKVAELLEKEGLEEEAVSEYSAVVAELRQQGAHDELDSVYERILNLRPEDATTLSAQAGDRMDRARFDEAEPFAMRALAASQEPELFEQLIAVYQGLGNETRESEVTRDLAALYRDRGDEDRAREVLQRLSPEAMMEASSFGLEGLASEASEAPHELVQGDQAYSPSAQDERTEESEPTETEAAELQNITASGFVSDSSDGLAEASVYLRYGKSTQAIESLQLFLAHQPGRLDALELLGQAYADNAQGSEAIECWRDALTLSRSNQDQAAFDAISRRMVDWDADLAGTIEPMASLEESSAALALESTSLDAHPPNSEMQLDLGADAHDTINLTSASRSISTALGSADSKGSREWAQSTTTAARIREDLEEAHFYLEQGLESEAEDAYRRVLEVAPQHPTALLKWGELVARRGEDPGSLDGSLAASEPILTEALSNADEECPDDHTDMQDVEDLFENTEIEIDVALDEPEEAIETSAEETFNASSADAVSLVLQQDDGDDVESCESSGPELTAELAAVLAEAEAAVEATAQSPLQSSGVDSDVDLEVPLETVVETATESAAPAREILSSAEPEFDLAAELADVFEEANRAPTIDPGQTLSGSTLTEGFEAVFSDFKKGVSAEVEAGDFDTHFDLAIAYREMALWEDALAQFETCLASDERRSESLHMMALCALELNRPEDAVAYLEQTLAGEEQPADRWAALYFDLGRAQCLASHFEAAHRAFDTVAGIDPSFPGLSEQRASLVAEHPKRASDENLENFDDLVGEFRESEPARSPARESFEQFDAAVIQGSDPGSSGVDPAPPARPDWTRPPIAKSKRPRKRKKISFV